jgi:hypothetical protein
MSTYRFMGRSNKRKLRLLRAIHEPELARRRAEYRQSRREKRAKHV